MFPQILGSFQIFLTSYMDVHQMHTLHDRRKYSHIRYTGFQTVYSWTVNNALWTEGQEGGVLGKVLGGDMPLGL